MATKPIQPITERIRKVVISLVVVIVLIIAQVWVWQFVYDQSVVFHELSFQEEQVAAVVSRARVLNDNYDRQKGLLDQLTAVIPSERNTLQVIERLEVLAGKNNLNILISDITEEFDEVMRIGEDEVTKGEEEALEKEGVFPLLVRAKVTGAAHGILEYVDEVEHLQELTRIKSFKMTPAIEALGPDLFLAEVEIIFYLQRN